jgi:16S rRNA (uracil1498-N3)-methyltransferase
MKAALSGSSQGSQPKEAWAFIGSEGGFSEREVELFQSLDLKPVTLGTQVLRVETACVATVSIIKYDFDLMR